jgi:hypothetical protein
VLVVMGRLLVVGVLVLVSSGAVGVRRLLRVVMGVGVLVGVLVDVGVLVPLLPVVVAMRVLVVVIVIVHGASG